MPAIEQYLIIAPMVDKEGVEAVIGQPLNGVLYTKADVPVRQQTHAAVGIRVTPDNTSFVESLATGFPNTEVSSYDCVANQSYPAEHEASLGLTQNPN